MRIALVAFACCLLGACMPRAPRVGYTPSGMAGNAVFFVESRADAERQYLVLCHPQRTPPCARVAPGTIRSRDDLARWLDTEDERRRNAAQVVRSQTTGRTVSGTTTVPLVAGDEWADSSVVVQAPQPPSEGAPVASAPGSGTVNVVTPGGWANVYDAEGHFLGQTPIQLRLEVGSQRISLRPFGQPPGDSAPIEVDVRAGETVSIVRRLETTPDVVGAQP